MLNPYSDLADISVIKAESLSDAVFEQAITKLKAAAGGQFKVVNRELDAEARLAYRDEKVMNFVVNSLPSYGLELVDETYPYEVRLVSR